MACKRFINPGLTGAEVADTLCDRSKKHSVNVDVDACSPQPAKSKQTSGIVSSARIGELTPGWLTHQGPKEFILLLPNTRSFCRF